MHAISHCDLYNKTPAESFAAGTDHRHEEEESKSPRCAFEESNSGSAHTVVLSTKGCERQPRARLADTQNSRVGTPSDVTVRTR